MQLAERVNRIEESKTLALAKQVRTLTAQGLNIINLTIGEPDFDTPEHIRISAKKAIDDGYTRYSPVAGFQDLRKAISEKFKRDNNLNFMPDQIVISAGAKQSFFNVCQALLNKNDEVIVPAPYWVSYTEIIKLADANPVLLKATIDQQFKITPSQLKNAITEKTKMFVFSSPSNPTGMVYSKAELHELAKVFAKFPNVFIVSDEIYEHINFNGKHETIAQFDIIKERVIVINGVSKGYAMTGWRLGYMGAAKWIADACEKIQGQVTSGANSITQMAAITALSSGLNSSNKMRDIFKKRRDLLIELLQNIPGIKTYTPMGAFYLFPNIASYFGKSYNKKTIQNATDMCEYLLHNAHVALVPGCSFGNSNCIRISYASGEQQITEAVKRIKLALEKLH